jgi:hypothetical protein
MIKWFAYIVLLLLFAPDLSSARIKGRHFSIFNIQTTVSYKSNLADTIITKGKKQAQDEKKKIKEVAKPKRQPKPEKIESGENTDVSKTKPKTKRQRRPEGLVRPPEIPRRNGN